MKHTHLLLLFTAVFMAAGAIGQPVIKGNKTVGGNNVDDFRAMGNTRDGGVIVGGYSGSGISGEKTENSKGWSDYWVIKFDSLGNKQWDKTVGSAGSDILFAVEQTTDGGYILGGYADYGASGDKTEPGFGTQDYWIVKLDSAANIQWDKTIGGSAGDYFSALQQTTDGGYILGGYSNSNISGNKTQNNFGDWDYWVVKTDSLGNVQWDITLGGNNEDWLSGLAQTLDGGYIAGGNSWSGISGNKTQASKGGGDYWVVKLNANGTVAWDKSIGSGTDDILYSLTATTNGGSLLGGSSPGNRSGDKTTNSKGGNDYWIVKLDATGNVEWDKTIGGSGYDAAWNVQQTRDGGYALAGFSESNISGDKSENSRGGNDYWLVKINKNGKKLWDKTAGAEGGEYYTWVREVKKNKFVLAGTSESGKSGDKTEKSRGDYDYWLVRIVYTPPSTFAAAEITTSTFTASKTMSISPNPAKDILHIQTNSKATVTLTDQSGKTIFTKIINGKEDININHLPAGVYYLKIKETGAVQKVTIAK